MAEERMAMIERKHKKLQTQKRVCALESELKQLKHEECVADRMEKLASECKKKWTDRSNAVKERSDDLKRSQTERAEALKDKL